MRQGEVHHNTKKSSLDIFYVLILDVVIKSIPKIMDLLGKFGI
jgi:hypothetical protein